MAFGIDMGPSSQENSAYNQLYGASGWATGAGEGDVNASQQFMEAILSGDPTKIASALNPQIKTMQDQSQQAKKTSAEFGTRSGGTAASNASIDANNRGNLSSAVSQLQGSAASSLGSMGTNLLGQGMSGFGTSFNEANTMQKQRANQWNDLFGSVASTATGVLGGLPADAGSFADKAGNFAGSF